MERAPLRPVPARPAGPVDPAAAVARGRGRPARARAARGARPRARGARRPAAGRGGRTARHRRGGARRAVGRARKELRQTLSPLSGSGWCERAERLISDRLDGALGETDGRRLDVHLRNCARCVEHERRLVQATDALLAGIAPARPRPAAADRRGAACGRAPRGTRGAGRGAAPADGAPPRGPERGALRPSRSSFRADGGSVPLRPGSDRGGRGGPRDGAGPGASSAAAITWNAMVAIAVILTVASIILIIAGALGAHSSAGAAPPQALSRRSTAAGIASSHASCAAGSASTISDRHVPGP